ncbi:MAG: thiamine-phosphate kinase [Bacteroidia bacterium]|nr:thiamine-phosphate kinase [Bacteroidia bacterium]
MFENKEGRTELTEMGEFGLIEHLTKHIEIVNPETVLGVGDDAAVFDPNGQVVVTTDMLVEGVHFDLSYVPLKHLGYKAVVVNLSDVYAMNAIPKQFLCSLAISNRFSLEALEELYSGMMLACKRYKVDFVGGDTTTSLSGLVISGTALGMVNKENLVKRNGAKVNDLICVSGDLGAAFAGLQILEREKLIYLENPGVQPDLEGKDYVLERQLKPEARKEIIQLFNSLGVVPTAMLDISDGLSSELLHLAKNSNVGVAIYEERLPIDEQTYEIGKELSIDPTTCALNGGEDYELLFTISQSDYDKIKGKEEIHIIGHITEPSAGKIMVTRGGHAIDLKAQGWNAFKPNSN